MYVEEILLKKYTAKRGVFLPAQTTGDTGGFLSVAKKMAPTKNGLRKLALLLLFFVSIVESKKARRSRRLDASSKLTRNKMHTYRRLVIFVFLAVLFPALASFCHSLATDPAVPQILRATGTAIKKRFSERLTQRKSTR